VEVAYFGEEKKAWLVFVDANYRFIYHHYWICTYIF